MEEEGGDVLARELKSCSPAADSLADSRRMLQMRVGCAQDFNCLL